MDNRLHYFVSYVMAP